MRMALEKFIQALECDFAKSKLHHGCIPEDDFKCFDQQYSKLIQNPVKHLRLGVF